MIVSENEENESEGRSDPVELKLVENENGKLAKIDKSQSSRKRNKVSKKSLNVFIFLGTMTFYFFPGKKKLSFSKDHCLHFSLSSLIQVKLQSITLVASIMNVIYIILWNSVEVNSF